MSTGTLGRRIRAVLGSHFEHADAEQLSSVAEEVRECIGRTTGVQTLAQMKALSELVVAQGFAAEGDIEDVHEYAAIYRTALMEVCAGMSYPS